MMLNEFTFPDILCKKLNSLTFPWNFIFAVFLRCWETSACLEAFFGIHSENFGLVYFGTFSFQIEGHRLEEAHIKMGL